MGHVFRPGLHACDAGGGLVFLDLAADRYFAFGALASDACRRLIAGDQAAPGAKLDELVARGILLRTDDESTPELCRPPPKIRSSRSDTDVRPPAGLVIAALARHAYANVERRLLPLERILASVARRKHAGPHPRGAAIDPAELAAAFAEADRVLTALGRCLPRSVAVARAMIAGGVEPCLVLGVKLRPFEAHCWVQHGDYLLSDDAGAIAPFTPILIV